jgi:hypothetical protein
MGKAKKARCPTLQPLSSKQPDVATRSSSYFCIQASTMEKSASDWIGFVQKEVPPPPPPPPPLPPPPPCALQGQLLLILTLNQGIADQLEENRKDGYIILPATCALAR